MTSALATMRVDYEQIRIKTIEDSTNPLLMKRRKKANNAVATPAAHWKMHACLPSHTNTGCEKEAISCRHVSRVAWIFLSFFFSVFYFSWQIVMFCKCLFLLLYHFNNSSLCNSRGDVDLCFYTTEEIMKFRKGENGELTHPLASSFLNIRLCTHRGSNVGIGDVRLSISSSDFTPPHKPAPAQAPNLWMLTLMAKSQKWKNKKTQTHRGRFSFSYMQNKQMYFELTSGM